MGVVIFMAFLKIKMIPTIRVLKKIANEFLIYVNN
jgi:hypothetical protein